MADPDAIVIGAGLAGASVAYWLSQTHRVRLVEQGATPLAEATAQNAGMLRTLGEDPAERALALRTHHQLATDPRWDGVSVRTGALLGLAHDPHHLTDAAAHLRAKQHPIAEEAPPAVMAQLGDALAQVWWLPEARAVDSAALGTRLLALAKQQGAELAVNTAVTGLRRSGTGVEVHCGETVWSAKTVVLAAGAWSAPLAASLGVQRPLFPLRRAVFRIPWTGMGPWMWIDDVGAYLRPEGSTALVCPCDERLDPPPPGPGSTGTVTDPQTDWMRARLARWFPQASPEFVASWTGLRTFAADRRPLLGPDPDCPGLVWAAGLGGFGVTTALGVGEAVARWIRGQDTPWLAPEMVSPGRFLPGRWPIRTDGRILGSRLIDGRRIPRPFPHQ